MIIEKWDVAPTELLTSAEAEYLWIELKERSQAEPLASPMLQWVDWKTGGMLSRHLLARHPDESPAAAARTDTPLFWFSRRLPFRLLAVESSRTVDWKRWQAQCKGLRVASAIYFCEEADRVSAVEKALGKFESTTFPERVVIACDQLLSK